MVREKFMTVSLRCVTTNLFALLTLVPSEFLKLFGFSSPNIMSTTPFDSKLCDVQLERRFMKSYLREGNFILDSPNQVVALPLFKMMQSTKLGILLWDKADIPWFRLLGYSLAVQSYYKGCPHPEDEFGVMLPCGVLSSSQPEIWVIAWA